MAEENKNKNENSITVFAETNFRGQRKKFGIKPDDRRRHVYSIGKTGMGKSVTLENMIYSDIMAGKGVAVVDPHGDLVEKVLDFIPTNRVNDVIYFNPADLNYPIAFNVFERVSKEHQHLIASGLVGVFKKIWAESWGPRLEYVLRNAILALLDYPDSTLLGVMRLLVDKNYRKKVITKIQDPVVKSFWVEEYSKYPDRFQAEAIAPIQNKVGQFLSNPLIRNIVGQVKSTIDIRDIMDNKKILLLNLSKGRIGEDNSALLGAMMITKIQLAAMSRVDVPEEKREDFYLYVDEFQNFSTESFANILSEARKYRLNLIIAHQYIEQLDETVQAAVFGNVGTIICFRVGAADADELVKEFTPRFTEEDLVNLPKYNVYLKLMIDGVASDPFSATTLPPLAVNTMNKDKIIRVSRERYAKPREMVEEKIARWSGMKETEKREVEEEKRPREKPVKIQAGPKKEEFKKEEIKKEKKKKEGIRYEAKCTACGKDTVLNFIPDLSRPIYCQECLKKYRRGELKMEEKTSPKEEKRVESISLNEAVKKEPISFKKKKAGAEIGKPQEKQKSEKSGKQAEKNKEDKKQDEEGIKPGEVIKIE